MPKMLKPIKQSRFTLSGLVDLPKLLEWLAYDSKPPAVYLPKENWHGLGNRPWEEVRLDSVESVQRWWKQYRTELANDFGKSALAPNRLLTQKQFVAQCLSALGIKGGTVEQRIKRAKEELVWVEY